MDNLADKLDVIFEREADLEALCRQLAEACKNNIGVLRSWAEHSDGIGVHCLTTDKAIKDGESALQAAKKAKVIDE